MTLKEQFELETAHGINNGSQDILVNQKGAEYIKWLESKLIEALSQHDVIKNEVAVCDHPISYRERDARFNLKCTKCGKIL